MDSEPDAPTALDVARYLRDMSLELAAMALDQGLDRVAGALRAASVVAGEEIAARDRAPIGGGARDQAGEDAA